MSCKIHFNKWLFAGVLFMSTGFFTKSGAQDENTQKRQFAQARITVLDEAGKPVDNVRVAIEDAVVLFTDKKGNLSVEAQPQDAIMISKPGFADLVTRFEELVAKPTVTLAAQPLFMAASDEVPLPFMTVSKRLSTSSSQVLLGDNLEKYPTIDVRNAFTGLGTGLQVSEKNGAPGLQAEEKLGMFGITEKIRMYSRGRSPIYMIDDVPTDVTEMQIEQQEIESATIIKDIAAKAMYGPQAADGIIYIKTRRGIANQNVLKVNAETGISVIDRFPEWTTGADYATLNNLARTNSGLEPLYSASDITAYSKNDAYNLYKPSIDYRSMMLKNSMAMRRANVSYQGGKEGVQFFTYMGYSGEDDIYKIGPQSDYNRLNARSNLDVTINELLSVHLNIFGGLTFRRSPNYGYDPQYGSDTDTDATLDIVEFNSVVTDISSISPIAFPVWAKFDSASNTPWYGVDPTFSYNPIGRIMDNGYYTEYGRSGATNIALDYNLKGLLPGLRSKTFFSFDIFNLVRTGKAEQYIAYNVTPSKTTDGRDTVLLTKAHDGVDMAGQAKLHDYYYQRFGGYQSFTYDKKIGANSFLQSSLTYYMSKVSRNQIREPERTQSLVLSGIFNHKNKYSLQAVLNYSGSSSLSPANRYELFPSVGAGWVISDESFLSGVSFINFLKLRGQAGILGFENFDSPFYYMDMWTYNTSGGSTGAAPTGYWFGSDTQSTLRSNPSRIGNPNLRWERRKEFTFGLDALLFDQKLAFEVNYYNNLRDGILTNLSYTVPYATGIAFANAYANFNKVRYHGFETSLQYMGSAGNLKYSFGGNATIQDSKVLQWDEPAYRNAYQSRVGKPADAYWGLTYLGKFASDAETEIIPQMFDESLTAGDLKYQDMNNDGVVDDNDRSMIGRTSPRLVYALNLKLDYKNFDLTMIADGIAFVDMPMTNNFFRNGWGNNNYSAFVRDNIGGAYPRLTYYQVNNNFQNSDFWLTKGGYLKLQNVELAYNFSQKSARAIYVRGVRLFVRGANLLTVTNVKYVDPESPSSGVTMYPLFSTFTGGVKLTF